MEWNENLSARFWFYSFHKILHSILLQKLKEYSPVIFTFAAVLVLPRLLWKVTRKLSCHVFVNSTWYRIFLFSSQLTLHTSLKTTEILWKSWNNRLHTTLTRGAFLSGSLSLSGEKWCCGKVLIMIFINSANISRCSPRKVSCILIHAWMW